MATAGHHPTREAAVYDLQRYRANFNFFEFLVSAATHGASQIIFDDSAGIRRSYSEEETAQRIKTILEPGCALAGCTFSYGSKTDVDVTIRLGYHLKTVIDAGKIRPITKLKSVLPPKTEKYTVTVRNCWENPNRNSDFKLWSDFSEKIGAFLIRDYYDRPIGLHDRMAYYAGAKMNYFVANGPAILCMLSDYPMTYFPSDNDRGYLARNGLLPGKKLPWWNDTQNAYWEVPTKETLQKYRPEILGVA